MTVACVCPTCGRAYRMPAGYRRYCTIDGTPLLPVTHSRSGRQPEARDAALITPEDLGATAQVDAKVAASKPTQPIEREAQAGDGVRALLRSIAFAAAMTALVVGASLLSGAGAEDRPTLPSPYSAFEADSDEVSTEEVIAPERPDAARDNREPARDNREPARDNREPARDN